MNLFINCCPRVDSRTKILAGAVLAEIGEYEEVNLYSIELYSLDENRINRRNMLIESGMLDSPEFALSRQFAAADTIVIAAPYWDLSFPSKLKLYIENIYVQNIVSRYNNEGIPVGLCRAEKLYYVTTAGGPYDDRFSYRYIETMCRDYFGIKSVSLIKADMLDVEGYNADTIISDKVKVIKEFM